jgi:hypothetical protein
LEGERVDGEERIGWRDMVKMVRSGWKMGRW